MPLFALTIKWHWSLKGCTDHDHKSTEFSFLDNSLLKETILFSKDHIGESRQWHERPAIVESNLKSILVFVKHPPVVTVTQGHPLMHRQIPFAKMYHHLSLILFNSFSATKWLNLLISYCVYTVIFSGPKKINIHITFSILTWNKDLSSVICIADINVCIIINIEKDGKIVLENYLPINSNYFNSFFYMNKLFWMGPVENVMISYRQ